MESTNIILVYCPPSRGLIHPCGLFEGFSLLLPPIAGIDTERFVLFEVVHAIAPIAGIDIDLESAWEEFTEKDWR